jgi:16S rRNA (guanine1207-N2)-methyltransferase
MGRREGQWRDRAAGQLAAELIAALDPKGPALILADPDDQVAESLASNGVFVERWDRRVSNHRQASPWPPAGPFGLAAMRWPRDKGEAQMTLHGAVGSLAVGGTLVVYGANDEGIKSAANAIRDVLGTLPAGKVGRHCRVLNAARPHDVVALKPTLERWRGEIAIDIGGRSRPWVTFPGLFAGGGLDAGTALLISALPEIGSGHRVLDFGCGSGIVAAAVLDRQPAATVDGLDNDAVALEALRHNVPAARPRLAAGIEACAALAYDLIVSNPAFHAGKAESSEVIAGLIVGAARCLEPSGILLLVAQRRLAIEPMLRSRFAAVEAADDDGLYRVWRAASPLAKVCGLGHSARRSTGRDKR